MFELLELDPRFSTRVADARHLPGDSAGPRPQGTANVAVTDDGQLSQGETLLLLAGLSSVVGSLWLTLTAIF